MVQTRDRHPPLIPLNSRRSLRSASATEAHVKHPAAGNLCHSWILSDGFHFRLTGSVSSTHTHTAAHRAGTWYTVWWWWWWDFAVLGGEGGGVGRSLNQKCHAAFIIQPVGPCKDPAQHPEAVACMSALLTLLSLGFPHSLFFFFPSVHPSSPPPPSALSFL